MSTLRVAAINNPSASSGGLAISASGNVTGAGLDLITTQSFSAVSSVSVNNCFSATYDDYRIQIRLTQASGQASWLRLRAGGADNSTSNYYYGAVAAPVSSTTLSNNYGSATAQIDLYGGFTGAGQHTIDISSPFASSATLLAFQSVIYPTTASQGNGVSGGAFFTGTNSFDGLTLLMPASNMTGTVSIYGYRK